MNCMGDIGRHIACLWPILHFQLPVPGRMSVRRPWPPRPPCPVYQLLVPGRMPIRRPGPRPCLSCLLVVYVGPHACPQTWPQTTLSCLSVVWPEATLSSLSSLSVYCLTPSVPFLPATHACSYWHTCPDFLLTATCPDFLSTCMPCLYVCPVPCLPPAIYVSACLLALPA